jgi:ligand-binding SRPBCC domain-containing protein
VQRFQLMREQYVPFDQEATFAFFSDARNLELLTPPWLHFSVRTPGTIELRAGSRIAYQLKVHGIPVSWQSEITAWEPPHRFVDVQRQGPYRFWQHTHRFEALGAGTVMRDELVYAVPGGGLVNRYLVAPDLRKIFDYRARQLDAWVLARVRQAAAPIR